MDNPTPTATAEQQQQQQHHPPEEIQHAEVAAAMSTAAAEAGVSVEESMRMLRDRQDEQARLLASMQSRIDELENEIRWFVGNDPTRQTVAAAATAEATMTTTTHLCKSPEAEPDDAMAMAIATSDDDIDAIIESRKQRSLWPLKRRYCTHFTHDADLVRVRFHVSDRYGHVSVRISKINNNNDPEGHYGLGNKEGRLICRLCSGKTMNRNTSWMCATCVVPLCVDVSNGDRESSCHARWHKCLDLVALNETLNSSLRERRTSRKRSRATTDDTIARWGALLPTAGTDATTTAEPLAKGDMAEEEPPPQDRMAGTDGSVSQID